MRFESATVPAAVTPDRSYDDGFEIPATVMLSNHGKASKTGISQKTCQTWLIFKAFGKKSTGSNIDSYLQNSHQR